MFTPQLSRGVPIFTLKIRSCIVKQAYGSRNNSGIIIEPTVLPGHGISTKAAINVPIPSLPPPSASPFSPGAIDAAIALSQPSSARALSYGRTACARHTRWAVNPHHDIPTQRLKKARRGEVCVHKGLRRASRADRHLQGRWRGTAGGRNTGRE